MTHNNKIKIQGRAKRLFLACVCPLMLVNAVHAADIVLRVSDGPNEGFNDPSAPFVDQTGNTGTTLGEQRLRVFEAAADYWEERLVVAEDVVVDIKFDDQFCQPFSATLGSAGPNNFFSNFTGAPQADTFYPSAVANNLAGRRLGSNTADISATFNSGIDNNDDCLRGTNWWLGINSPAPRGTIGLFDTVLHEIGHGLGVVSGVRQSGQLLGGLIDSYAYHLYDESEDKFWRDMTVAERVTSAVNTGNVTFRGPSVDANTGHITVGKTDGHLRIYAPNPYESGSSISHWDTVLRPDELMEPSATPTSDDRATLQLLKDVGWGLTQDINAGVISFLSASASVNEAQNLATIELRRSGGSSGAVSVRVNSADNTATAGQDYTAISNRLVSWADGETGVKTVSVNINNDDDIESDETLTLSLSGVTGGATITTDDLTLTIVSDDVASPGVIGFVSVNLSASETQGSVPIQLSRTGGSGGAVSVRLNSVAGTATAGQDYTAINNRVVSWGDGESGIKSVSLNLIDDDTVEVDETVSLTLSNLTGGAGAGALSAVLTISSNDVSVPGIVGFVNTRLSVIESAGGAEFFVQRTSGSDGPVSVTVSTQNNTAVAGEDFTAITNQVVSWLNGEGGTKSVVVAVNDDGLIEGDQELNVVLSNVTGGANLANSLATLTIQDPPLVPLTRGSVGFARSQMSVEEGTGGVRIDVRRIGGDDGAMSVQVRSFDITTAVGDDYAGPVDTVLSWMDGQSGLRSFVLEINDDDDLEDEERFELIVSALSDNTSVTQSRLLITVQDNDETVAVTPNAEADILQFMVPIISVLSAKKKGR